MSHIEEKRALKRKKSKKLLSYFILLLVFVAVGVVASYGVYYAYGIRPATQKSGDFYVKTGTTYEQLANNLVDKGFLKDTSDYLRFGRKLGYDRVYPGYYKIKDNLSLKALYRVVNVGAQTPVMVTFNNIRTFEKLAGIVSKKIEADSLELLKAFKSASIQKKYGFDSANFSSMFIPNSYQFYWNSSADDFIERMNKEYNSFWSKSSRDEKAKALGMSREEVSRLASIIIEESKAQTEFKRIAGVYINRLKRGMLLQADPTVKFAMGDMTIKRVLYKHLEYDSPYNTYKYAGLPPGPICVPPVAAIDAVLDYEHHNYYYFCASDKLNGRHLFAKTLSEHNRNAAAYAAALNRLSIR